MGFGMVLGRVSAIVRSRPASMVGASLLMVGVVLGSESQANALTLDYRFSSGITFSYGNPTTTRSLSGSFSLDCGSQSASSCVTLAQPSFVQLDNENVVIGSPNTSFNSGIYGRLSSGSYYLQFSTGTGASQRSLRLILGGSLPSAPFGATQSLVRQGSYFCNSTNNNELPGNCPPGQTSNLTQITPAPPGATVILVPSPFALALLAPASLLLCIRRRYTG